MKPHQNLEAWKKSFQLVKELYSLTSKFPAEERFGLNSQIRRASVSVPTNIAEGAARNTKREFVNFLHISLGSLSELDTLILLCADLNLISQMESSEVILKMDVIAKLIKGLINKLRKDM